MYSAMYGKRAALGVGVKTCGSTWFGTGGCTGPAVGAHPPGSIVDRSRYLSWIDIVAWVKIQWRSILSFLILLRVPETQATLIWGLIRERCRRDVRSTLRVTHPDRPPCS